MRWLFSPLLREFVLTAGAASLLLNLAMLVPSLYSLQVFDRVFASRSIETLLMLTALTLIALAFAYCMDVGRARAPAAAGLALQEALSAPVLEQALRQAATSSPGRGGAGRLRDIAQLRGFLAGGGIRALFDAPWLPVYLLVIALMHPLLGAVAAAGAGVLALLALATERLTRDDAALVLRSGRQVGRDAESLARHAELFGAMGMIERAVAAWHAGHDRWRASQARLVGASAHLAALARVLRQGVQLAVLGTGAWLVVDRGASPGIMVAATVLLGRALQPVEALIGGWRQVLDARAAWRSLCEPGVLRPLAGRLALPAPRGRLRLESVVFAHAAAPPVIKGVSFSVEPGESLGIVGASGSGKSTLARLVLGVWQPQSGAVRLDGASLVHWERADLGIHVGYLPQDVTLFAATVAQNIARLGPVDAAAVVDAARLAGAHDLILRLAQGYDTRVGEGGSGLSGGQRQRIGLACALYRNPPLVVLDEPDAHLDAEGEAALRAALRGLKLRGTTVVLTGHRTGLLAQLDRIAVLRGGVLQGIGPAATMLDGLQAGNVRSLPALGIEKGWAA